MQRLVMLTLQPFERIERTVEEPPQEDELKRVSNSTLEVSEGLG
jgi:hypothetical protein